MNMQQLLERLERTSAVTKGLTTRALEITGPVSDRMGPAPAELARITGAVRALSRLEAELLDAVARAGNAALPNTTALHEHTEAYVPASADMRYIIVGSFGQKVKVPTFIISGRDSGIEIVTLPDALEILRHRDLSFMHDEPAPEDRSIILAAMEMWRADCAIALNSNISLELADITTTLDGSFAAKLPWRQYPGLLIDGQTIQAALQLARPLVAGLVSQSLDASHIETMIDRLSYALDLLDSKESTILISAPDAPKGKGTCLRPAPLVRLHNHLHPFVLFHLDTLASFVGGIKLSSANATQPSILTPLHSLLLTCESWYSQL